MNTTQHARRTIWTIRDSDEERAGWKLEHEAGEDTLTIVQVAPETSFLEELSPEVVQDEIAVPISHLLELYEAFSGTVLPSYHEEWLEDNWTHEVWDGCRLHSASGERAVTLEDELIEAAMVFEEPLVLDEFLPYLEEAIDVLYE